MNKRELAKAVAVQADVTLSEATNVLEEFTRVVTAVVAKGEPVVISGFAKFVKVERAARMGRNPATGEAIRIKASKKARITPVKAFKDAVMSPSGAPRLNRGVWPTDPEALKAAGKPAPAPAGRAAAATKTSGRRGPAKKAATRATTARSAAAKKTTTRRATGRTSAVRTAPAKKTVARKAPAKKAATKKSARR